MRRIILTILIVFFSAVAVIIILYKIIELGIFHENKTLTTIINTGLIDSFKLIIQLLFVVIGGHFILHAYNVRRQKKADAKEFRGRIHTLLVNAYLNTKRSRLILRANCKNGFIPYISYEKEIIKIIDTKIELEIISHEIAENQKYLKQELRFLKEIENMENYLRNLVKEFTSGNNPPFDGSNMLNVTTLTSLDNFINGKQLDEQTEENLRRSLVRKQKLDRSHFSLFYRKYFYDSLDILKAKEENELVQD